MVRLSMGAGLERNRPAAAPNRGIQHCLSRAKTYPDKPVLIFDGGVLTFGQVDALSDQLAQACAARDSCAETESGCSYPTSRNS
jgi:hypothetical protein